MGAPPRGVRRRAQLPMDLLHDPRYAVKTPLWDTWFRGDQDMRRKSFFASRACAPTTPCVSVPSPSPSPPSLLQAMDVDEEDKAFKKALEDSKIDRFKEWEGLNMLMALLAAGNVNELV